jgi:hypothetical protein
MVRMPSDPSHLQGHLPSRKVHTTHMASTCLRLLPEAPALVVACPVCCRQGSRRSLRVRLCLKARLLQMRQ